MPRVTDAYREARRDEIARAAIRCLERNGVRDTSIADIVAESGLSTGAIYSHFSNKAELARYVAERFLLPRVDALEAEGRRGEMLAPRDACRRLLAVMGQEGLSPSLVLQFWGEAMADPDLRAGMNRTVDRLRVSLAAAVTPWARTQVDSDDAAAALAVDSARAIAALAQGYVANTAVFGARDADEYLASATAVLAS